MTAKIEWYREVLELEPNSKVFFPLARLLAEDGNREEAITLLERGLERHPEFLEARLFRIELLFQEGRKAECNAEIAKLSKMFASYAGFWQAWAACLASEQGQSDTASLIRFLAAHFVSGPLHLHEVLNRGLDALLKDRKAAQQGHAQPDAPQEPLEAGFEPTAEIDVNGPASDARESQPVVGDASEENPAEQVEAAEAFMANAGDMLADLDSELESAQPATSALAQPEQAIAEHESPAAEPPSADEDLAATAQVAEENGTDAALLGEPEAAPTEMDEIPAVVVNDAPEEVAIPAYEHVTETIAPESEDQVEEEDLSLPEDASEIPATNALGDNLDAAEAFDLPLPQATLEDELASGMKLEADSLEITPAAPDLEADMQAIMAEPEPDLGADLPEQEPAVEAVVSAGALEEEQPSLEEALAPDSSGPESGQQMPESEIEPEIAAQLTAPEADFFAAPLEQEQPRQAPVTLAEAEAAMVDGLELPDMNPPAVEETSANLAPAESEPVEEPEEPFSLRTRSMAEVLAEQGDIQGALDIYEELAAAATSGDEVEDINRRVATLRGRLSMANASANFNAAEEASAAQNKEKLISMLEALAQRVEARAQ